MPKPPKKPNGIRVKNDLVKNDRMKTILQQKFKQHPLLQDALVNTGANTLIEATYDKYWGAGLPLSARGLKDGNWSGRNWLGTILGDIRTEIKRERAAAVLNNPQVDYQTTIPPATPNQPKVSPQRQPRAQPPAQPPAPPKPPRQSQIPYPPLSQPPPLMSNDYMTTNYLQPSQSSNTGYFPANYSLSQPMSPLAAYPINHSPPSYPYQTSYGPSLPPHTRVGPPILVNHTHHNLLVLRIILAIYIPQLF